MKRPLVIVMLLVGSVMLATPALGHVTVQPNEALAGSFARFVVRVPNERADASTVKVEVEFPELLFVSFEDAPGWTRRVEMRELAEPLESEGERVDESVGAVTWEGGNIEPGEFAEFGFSARMSEQPHTLRFPALQTYDSGEVVRWIGPADADEPAARLRVVDLGAEEGHGQLSVLASLKEERGEFSRADVLGLVGIALGALALLVALLRRRRI